MARRRDAFSETAAKIEKLAEAVLKTSPKGRTVARHPGALPGKRQLEREAAPGRAGRPEAEALLLQRLDGEEVHCRPSW